MGSTDRFRWSAGAAALVVSAFAVTLAVRPGGEETVRWIDDMLTFSAAAIATLACAVAARRSRRGWRAGWAVLALAMALWSFGEGAWGWYELGTGSVPFPSVADIGYLLAVPVVVVALLLFPSADGVIARTRSALDGMIVAGSLLIVSWATVLGPVYRAGTGTQWDQAITLAYPIGDIVTAAMVLLVLARQRSWARSPLVLVGLGLMAMAVSDSVYAYASQVGGYNTGGFEDVGWVVGYLLIALAAVRPRIPTTDVSPRDPVEVPLARILLPYGVLLLGVVTGVTSAVVRRQDDPMLLAVGVLLAALVIGRQLLTLLDNRRLNAELSQKILELGARERELQHLAFHDPLTGLPNRTQLFSRLEEAHRAGRSTPLCLMFVDLDDFKTVNDSLGHEAGDSLLVEVAARIRRCMGPDDIAARLGGDEFGLLVHTPRPAALAAQLQEELRATVPIGGRDVSVRASIGIARSALGEVPAEELLRQADTAMYAAKSRGKGTYEVFDSRMGAVADERLELREALGTALATGQLQLHYQPIVDLSTGRTVAAEALARWTHPTRGPVSPAIFIPLAEENGLIDDLGRWALLQACEAAATWDGIGLSVNLSAAQIQNAGVVDAVAQALAVTGLAPERLTLEITESVLMRHTDLTLARLRALRTLGVKVAIDDFGTGYSSLSYLPSFPVDTIKIDQSFVRAITTVAGRAVLRAIVELARELGLEAVAEGIETGEQAEQVRSAGCGLGQGFWLGRPAPVLSPTQPSRAALRPAASGGG